MVSFTLECTHTVLTPSANILYICISRSTQPWGWNDSSVSALLTLNQMVRTETTAPWVCLSSREWMQEKTRQGYDFLVESAGQEAQDWSISINQLICVQDRSRLKQRQPELSTKSQCGTDIETQGDWQHCSAVIMLEWTLPKVKCWGDTEMMFFFIGSTWEKVYFLAQRQGGMKVAEQKPQMATRKHSVITGLSYSQRKQKRQKLWNKVR